MVFFSFVVLRWNVLHTFVRWHKLFMGGFLTRTENEPNGCGPTEAKDVVSTSKHEKCYYIHIIMFNTAHSESLTYPLCVLCVLCVKDIGSALNLVRRQYINMLLSNIPHRGIQLKPPIHVAYTIYSHTRTHK